MGAGASVSANPMINLNTIGYVQYGDGQSYSLPNAIFTNCGGTASGCQYSVDSTPGAIKNLVVLATGAGGVPLVTNFPGMDMAYATPSGVSGSTFFSMNSTTNLGFSPTVNNNNPNTWDSSLAAMKNFLSGDQMVFFFNNNQTNSGGASAQSLAAWAQVSITNATNGVVGVYDFTNRNSKYALFTEGGGGNYLGSVASYTSAGIGTPIAGNNSNTDYVLSGGAICYLANVPVSCSNPHDRGPLNHNLGADHAAYAVLFPELNAQLNSLFASLSAADLANFTLHVDLRIGCDAATAAGNCTGNGTTVPYGRDLNNGFEQLFIGTAAAVGCPLTDPNCNPIPEPGSLSLLGLGLASFAAMRLRRRSRR